MALTSGPGLGEEVFSPSAFQLKRVRKQLDGMRVGASCVVPLDVTDRARAEPGPMSQFFLSQTECRSVELD
jgi:hypothetical protein